MRLAGGTSDTPQRTSKNAAERHKHGNDDLSHYADYVDDVAEELRKSLANAPGNASNQ